MSLTDKDKPKKLFNKNLLGASESEVRPRKSTVWDEDNNFLDEMALPPLETDDLTVESLEDGAEASTFPRSSVPPEDTNASPLPEAPVQEAEGDSDNDNEDEGEEEEGEGEKILKAMLKCEFLGVDSPEDGFTDYSNIVNVAVIGTDESSKTSILTRLFGYEIGCVPAADLFNKKVEIGKQEYMARIFTNTGQERFQWANDIMFRMSLGFILVYNVYQRESFEAVSTLYNYILEQRDTEHIPCLIIAEHSTSKQGVPDVMISEGHRLSAELGGVFVDFDLCDNETFNNRFIELIKNIQHFQHGFIVKKIANKSHTASKKIDEEDANLPELEIVVIGDAFVGKTSLVRKMSQGSFQAQYKASKDIDRRRTKLTINIIGNKRTSETYMLNIVDTPGFFIEQLSKKSGDKSKTAIELGAANAVEWLKQQSLIGMDAVIIVYSILSRDSFNFALELKKMIKPMRSDNKIVPFALVATNSEAKFARAVWTSEGQAAATELGCLFDEISIKESAPEITKGIFSRLVGEIYRRNNVTTSDFSDELDKAGYLFKGSNIKKCKNRRFFVLKDHVISYGNNEINYSKCKFPLLDKNNLSCSLDLKSKDQRKKTILTKTKSMINPPERSQTQTNLLLPFDNKFHFFITSGDQSICVATESATERTDWMNSINANIAINDVAESLLDEVINAQIGEILKPKHQKLNHTRSSISLGSIGWSDMNDIIGNNSDDYGSPAKGDLQQTPNKEKLPGPGSINPKLPKYFSKDKDTLMGVSPQIEQKHHRRFRLKISKKGASKGGSLK